MHILKRSIGVLLLLALLSANYSMLFGQSKEQAVTAWDQSAEDPSEQSKEKEENKEVSTPFDELFYHGLPALATNTSSWRLNAHYLQNDTTGYSPSMHLPPEL